MSGFAQKAKRLRNTACTAFALSAVSLLATEARADTYRIVPTLTVEQLLTDNVRVSQSDRDADAVTTVKAAVDGTIITDRAQALIAAEINYDEFWFTDDLDNLDGSGIAAGRLGLFRDLLFVDGLVESRIEFFDTAGQSAAGLPTGRDQARVSNYEISPFIQTDIFNFADVLLRARYARAFFDEPVVGLIPGDLPDDATTYEGSGLISTGDRIALYELLLSGEHIEDDNDFESDNIVGGLIWHMTPRFDAIGHLGYEKIFQPTFDEIKGTIWSAGGRYRFGRQSDFHLEFGERFDDNSWLGDLNLVFGRHIAVRGHYVDSIQTAQASVSRSYEDLLDQEGSPSVGTPTGPFLPDPSIPDETFRERSIIAEATYTLGLRHVSLGAQHRQRDILSNNDQERTISAYADYYEQLTHDLGYQVQLGYYETLEALQLKSESTTAYVRTEAYYQFLPDMKFKAGYNWQKDYLKDGTAIPQNILRFSVEKTFDW